MADQADSRSTPAAQQQHNPPSLPTSPHPKRVKTDDLLNDSATMPSSTSVTAQLPSIDNASTPTPSNPPANSIPTFDPSTLPPVSSLLPSLSNNPSLPMPPMISNGDGNNLMNMPSMGDVGHMPPMQMQPLIPSMGNAPIVPLPTTAPPPLMVKRLVPEATTPTRGSAFAAGYDLYAAAPLTLKAKSKGLISTGLAIATPAGTYGRVAPRSGLASKHFLDTGAGVIDADYRGEVKVLMFNFSDVDYEVKQGERVAQLVLERIMTPEVVEVQELEDSVRGVGGFGSTGYI